jgi:phage shock protein E
MSDPVMDRIKAGATILDVRTPDEYRDGGYPGSVNIPLQVLAARINEVPKDKPVVVYCLSGGRSAQAARLLKSSGWTDVVNAGGLADMPR